MVSASDEIREGHGVRNDLDATTEGGSDIQVVVLQLVHPDFGVVESPNGR